MIVLTISFVFFLFFLCSNCLFDSSMNKVTHEMALELFLCINFIFCERNPMVYSMFATNAVLPVEESINEAV